MHLEDTLVESHTTIRDLLDRINASGTGVALVVEEDRTLIETVTDGDVRRALLDGVELDAPLQDLLRHMKKLGSDGSITASPDTPRQNILTMMKRKEIRNIPIVDPDGRVVDLATRADVVGDDEALDVTAVVMAGGYGTRLKPLTDTTPKVMLPVGGRPVLDRLVHNLRDAGIREIMITTHYRHEDIVDHFGDGSDMGVSLTYVHEEKPLGTAGALDLLPPIDEDILVINGDILTQVDFPAMLQYHREREAQMTIGVRRYEAEVPYGVVETEGATVEALHEKPSYEFFVNAGIYMMDPRIPERVPKDTELDMTDLIDDVLADGGEVISFPIHEYWLDIGQPDDYRKAQEEFQEDAA